MMPAFTSLRCLIGDSRGVTAIEYGLIAALIVLVIAASVVIVGTQLNTVFANIGTCLSTAGATCP